MAEDGKRLDFDKVAATWDQEPRRVKLVGDIARAIVAELQPDSTMDAMDFGCGTGLLSLALQPLVHSIACVDSSRGMLDVLAAKSRECGLTNVTTRLVDGEQEVLSEGAYHLVVSSMALHHVRDIGRLFRQFYDALAPSGSLGIADLDLDGGEFHADSTGVFHNGFERENLRRTLAEAGFTNIHVQTVSEIIKTNASGNERKFTVFLMTARKLV